MTATRTDNNGTDLQALAMLNLFRRMGASDVELIDYECYNLESSKHLLKPLSLRKILYYPINLCLHYKHTHFRKQFLVKSATLYNKDTISLSKYDKIVVGSDQIWNLTITGGDLSFFLPFAGNGLQKYSYAASIGRDDINAWEKEYHLSEKLRDFKAVSVREESAIKTLSCLGINARYDLDPILMGSVDDWRPLLRFKRKKKYVLAYFLESCSPAWSDVKKYAVSNGLEVINISPALRIYAGMKTLRCVGVEDWLGFVANAEMIFTSSYHCLSFAILFNKKICLVPIDNSIQSNSRMIDLLYRVGMEKCIYNVPFDYRMTINWDAVNEKLEKLRRISCLYIKSIIMN